MADSDNSAEETPLVSICIPARNEELNIERSVSSALTQNYEHIEVIVLDDQSTDNTPEILNEIKSKHPDILSIITGKNKPDNWLGKSWACHQMSKKAYGEILFFIDADVELTSRAVQRAVSSLQEYRVDFITLWPMQRLGTFWERVVIPIIYYGLLGLLPARYVHRKPSWIPSSLEKKVGPAFAAACGQCMVFDKVAYRAIGGHAAVKNDIVEDVALAKEIKHNGFSMRMFHGRDTASCRMYRSAGEMWNGFRKNFLGLFNNSVLVFTLMAIINFLVYILPIITLTTGFISGNQFLTYLSALSLFLMVGQRIVLASWYDWEKKMALLHPVGVLWFHILGVRVLWDHLFGKRAAWKKRPTA